MLIYNVGIMDMEFLYDLHNHPEIRAVSHNTESFTWEDHCKWWDWKLSDMKFQAGLIVVGKPIGCIRRDRGIVFIAILPEYQGKGYGTKALRKWGKEGDKAEILPDNENSMKAFKRAGFEERFITVVR